MPASNTSSAPGRRARCPVLLAALLALAVLLVPARAAAAMPVEAEPLPASAPAAPVVPEPAGEGTTQRPTGGKTTTPPAPARALPVHTRAPGRPGRITHRAPTPTPLLTVRCVVLRC